MIAKRLIRKFLRRTGYDIVRFTPISHPIARRKHLFQSYDIDVVLDVGANAGQFARQLRNELGYSRRVVSFEPTQIAYRCLQRHAQRDDQWDVFNYALGDVNDIQHINIAGNSYSSSLLNMLSAHQSAAPESSYIGTEEIEVKTLDSVFDSICQHDKHIYLKIDTQGFESKVIAGAENVLQRIDTIQLEMSLVPLYEGELLFDEMCAVLRARGYNLVAAEAGFSDKNTGHLLQMDGIFRRQRTS